MSEILPKRDFSYPVFSQKCVNYANLKIAKKQRNSSAFTTNTEFTSTSFWVKLPKLGNITQPRVILPLTTFESIIENIYAIRNNKTRMFRPKIYPNQEKFTRAALGLLGTFSRSGADAPPQPPRRPYAGTSHPHRSVPTGFNMFLHLTLMTSNYQPFYQMNTLERS